MSAMMAGDWRGVLPGKLAREWFLSAACPAGGSCCWQRPVLLVTA
jgi:hypothetical protein